MRDLFSEAKRRILSFIRLTRRGDGERNPPRGLTFLLISRNERGRSISISALALKIFAALGAVSMVALVLLAWAYRANLKELAELQHFRDLAQSQTQQIQALQDQYNSLLQRVNDAEAAQSQLGEMLKQEGLIKQSYTAPEAGRSSSQRTPIASRGSSRVSSADDMQRAVQSLNMLQSSVSAAADRFQADTDTLAKQVNEIISKSRATPSIWPVSGEISSPFGWRTDPFNSGRSDYHPGVDIAASYGQTIHAAAWGKVVFSGYKYGYGWAVIIDHGYGYETLYAHCSRLLVDTGEEVKRGDAIALVGQSGSATGPHLHYEVHLWGSNVNPTSYLP